MSSRRSPAHDLHADLMADLAGSAPLPGAEPLPRAEPVPAAAPEPTPPPDRGDGAPALEVRLTPTRWALRRQGPALQVGPLRVALTR